MELALPKRLLLTPADDRHPDLVALCSGPLVLFAVGEDLPRLDVDEGPDVIALAAQGKLPDPLMQGIDYVGIETTHHVWCPANRN